MFAPSFVGEEFHLTHVKHPEGKQIYLETLSLSPKVFDIHGFFVESEADDIVDRALNQKSESHKLKRSSTGANGYSVSSTRTSENAFDTHSKVRGIVERSQPRSLSNPNLQHSQRKTSSNAASTSSESDHTVRTWPTVFRSSATISPLLISPTLIGSILHLPLTMIS